MKAYQTSTLVLPLLPWTKHKLESKLYPLNFCHFGLFSLNILVIQYLTVKQDTLLFRVSNVLAVHIDDSPSTLFLQHAQFVFPARLLTTV